MLRDYLAGQARLRGIPLRERIVLALAAAEADQVPVAASRRDLADQVGVANNRWLQEELAELVRQRRVSVIPASGTRPNLFRLRPVEDWLDAPWQGDRRSSLAAVATARESRRNRQAMLSRTVTGSLGPYQRPGHTGQQGALVARAHRATRNASGHDTPGNYEPPSGQATPGNKLDGDRGAHCFTSEEVNLLLEEEEEGTPTQKHGAASEQLVAAVEQATGKPLFGRPRAQLEELGQRANGNLAAMLEAASRPGSAGFTIRIAEIERIASGERETLKAERAARDDPRRRTWTQALAAARLCGDEELASEAQAMLDTMGP